MKLRHLLEAKNDLVNAKISNINIILTPGGDYDRSYKLLTSLKQGSARVPVRADRRRV